MMLEGMVMGMETETVAENLTNRIPMGRLGLPDDVDKLAGFLASDDAEFITGQAYNLTGGRELTRPNQDHSSAPSPP